MGIFQAYMNMTQNIIDSLVHEHLDQHTPEATTDGVSVDTIETNEDSQSEPATQRSAVPGEHLEDDIDLTSDMSEAVTEPAEEESKGMSDHGPLLDNARTELVVDESPEPSNDGQLLAGDGYFVYFEKLKPVEDESDEQDREEPDEGPSTDVFSKDTPSLDEQEDQHDTATAETSSDVVNSKTKQPLYIGRVSKSCLAIVVVLVVISTVIKLYNGGREIILRDECKALDIYAVVGRTGLGKSTFVDKLGGRDSRGHSPEIGHELESCTTTPVYYKAMLHGSPICVLDTPGFDDLNLDDVKIMQDIFDSLPDGRLIKGMIYMYDIVPTRMSPISLKHIERIKDLCGPGNLHRVMLVTVKKDPYPLNQAERNRVQKLKTTYWKPLSDAGAEKDHFNNTAASAAKIIGRLSQKPKRMQIAPEVPLPPPKGWREEIIPATERVVGYAGRALGRAVSRRVSEGALKAVAEFWSDLWDA